MKNRTCPQAQSSCVGSLPMGSHDSQSVNAIEHWSMLLGIIGIHEHVFTNKMVRVFLWSNTYFHKTDGLVKNSVDSKIKQRAYLSVQKPIEETGPLIPSEKWVDKAGKICLWTKIIESLYTYNHKRSVVFLGHIGIILRRVEILLIKKSIDGQSIYYFLSKN